MMTSFRIAPALVLCLVGWLSAHVTGQDQDLNTEYLPNDAFVAVFGKPHQVLLDPQLSMIPREVLTAVSQDSIGIDPVQIESLLVFLRLPTGPGAPQWGAIAHFEEPQTLRGNYLEQCDVQELDGKPFYVNEGFDNPPSLFLATDRTLLVGDADTIPKMVASKMADSSLIRLLDEAQPGAAHLQAIVAWDMIRPMMLEELETAGPPPPPFGQLVAIGEVLEVIKAELNFGSSLEAKVQLVTQDNESAQTTADTLNRLLDFAQTTIVAQAQQEMSREPDVASRAMGKYIERIGEEIVDSLTPKVEGNQVTMQAKDQFTQSGVLIALLLPAVQSAREAARRAQSQNNLRQIAIAMHMYHDAKQTFPAQASFGDDGTPLLSWRVHLLPYLEQKALYEQFHLDEPWDSEHNIKLAEQMPQVFASPNSPSRSKTIYLALASGDGLMKGKMGRSIRDIRDGTSNTIMFVEADMDQAVTWTQPDDLDFDANRPWNGLGTLRPGGMIAAFCDGSIRFLSSSVDRETLKALVTVDGREIVDLD